MIKEDGYELYIKEYISGREVYDYRFYGVDVADKMDKNAIRDLIDEFKSGLIAKASKKNWEVVVLELYTNIIIIV